MKVLLCVLGLSALFISPAISQEDEKGMPRLDIPEITIVGKKAITLPFARKGEVLDIDLYEAPPPDSSLFTERPYGSFPAGVLPRLRETVRPWRAYVEAGGGTFSTFHLTGVLGYADLLWDATLRGSGGRTGGHVSRAEGSTFSLGVDGSAIIATDNDVLGRFRTTASIGLSHEEYGMFGIRDSAVDRTRKSFSLQAHISPAERRGIDFGFGLGVQSTSLQDEHSGGNWKSSAVSPFITTSVGAGVGAVRISTAFRYESSSLDYTGVADAPTLLDLASTVQWRPGTALAVTAGARYAHASHSDGGSGTLFSPLAVVRIAPLPNSSLSAWWEPEVRIASLAGIVRDIPYIIREPVHRHERKPVHGGITASHNTHATDVDVSVSYAETRETPYAVAANGLIALEYARTRQVKLSVAASHRLGDETRLYASALIQQVREKGNSKQLPMTPQVRLDGRGELSLPFPLKLWSSVEYVGSRNVDRAGTSTLEGFVLLHAGATSTILPSTLLSIDLRNLLGRRYDWWEGYGAPGTSLMVRAQYTL